MAMDARKTSQLAARKPRASATSSGSSVSIRTVAELAELAGVSPATVSRALADNPVIGAETRRRIQAIAREAGFTVNPAARMLRTRVSNTIALILPLGHEKGQHLSDPFFSAMLAYLADDVSQRGYDLLLRRVDPPSGKAWLKELIDAKRLDGVIVLGQSDQLRALQEAGKAYKRMVVWGQWTEDQSYVSVGTDNVSGGRLAGEHLLSRGRRRLAFLGNTSVPEFAARYAGFTSSLEPEALAGHRSAQSHLTADDAFEAAETLLREHPDIDGVFAASDVIAMSVIRAAVSLGRRVPEDLSVVGYDDVPLAAQSNPPLTTIRQDFQMGSSLLCDLLFKLMDDDSCSSVQLAPQIVVRHSS